MGLESCYGVMLWGYGNEFHGWGSVVMDMTVFQISLTRSNKKFL